MRRQDWSQVVSATALLAALAALLRGHPRRAVGFMAAAIAGDTVARRWSRGEPAPLPYALRWELAIPRPTGPLRRALAAREGERILEIGPGLGQHAVEVAGYVGLEGRVDVLDVQQEMLDATAARAERRGVRNIVAALAESSGRLPYEDACFDAAYIVTVLGEIADRRQTLVELRRVLKPGGRLIVGEIAVDPDFVPARQLCPMAAAAGFRLVRRFGPPFAYHAQFVAA
ncbi:MAG TPA: class I SAM-dependent methyltransferase [Solirubrobacteraceae bacterium]|jgi:SAM-dependent methyltransferase|nr:class I SAM-dependent methyltransferase [Solirubrobacteraceae bacterium]